MDSITVALAGNPNSGKTTIFNALTGARQKTGNWPGVTVERKEGTFRYKGKRVKVIDLPGTYGLSGMSIDEKIARNFIMESKPDIVVVVADSLNLERSLNLAVQILELGQRIIIDLNMMDMAKKKGIEIDAEKLSKILKCKVVKTVGHKGKGIEDLKEAILSFAESPPVTFKLHYPEDIEKFLYEIEKIIWDFEMDTPIRFIALRLLSRDETFIDMFKTKKKVYRSIKKILDKLPDDIDIKISEARYGFVHGVYKEVVKKTTSLDRRINLSDKIDRILTNRFIGLPIFILIIFLTFELIFAVGTPLANIIDRFFEYIGIILKSWLENMGGSKIVISLITDGIIGGVGSIVVFLPNIFLLFFVFAILEDSGYMARAAFIMDRIMHLFGLHGKSFIPMILGFGCNVPAVMGTRILESEKDRILTILIIPLMSCSARLPIYILFAGVFFPGKEALVISSLYLMGIILAIIAARIFKFIFFKEPVAPLIIELPPYRFPSIKNVIISASTKSGMFLKKAGTFIFLAAIVIWFLASFPQNGGYGSEKTLLGMIGKFITPIFAPLGFGFWQSTVSLIFGVFAKELVVGTLGTLIGGSEGLRAAVVNYFTPISAVSFMVFSLLYFPCIATFAVIKKEVGWKWAIISGIYTLLLAWITSFAVYNLGKLLF